MRGFGMISDCYSTKSYQGRCKPWSRSGRGALTTWKKISTAYSRGQPCTWGFPTARSTSCTRLRPTAADVRRRTCASAAGWASKPSTRPSNGYASRASSRKRPARAARPPSAFSATGRALVAEKVRPVIEDETAAMHAFSPAELAQALDLLERYRNALANALAEKGMV